MVDQITVDQVISTLRGSKENLTLVVKTDTDGGDYQVCFVQPGNKGRWMDITMEDMNSVYEYLKRSGIRLNVQFLPELILTFTHRGWGAKK